MPEVNVRTCYIHLLDGSKLSLQVKPLQLASELLSIIAFQLKVRDKEYFGLYYDVNGEYQYWLQSGRPVVEQVPGTNLDIIILHFGVLVYIENFRHLQDGMALNLYYNQCQQLIYQGMLHCQQLTLIKLAALVLQINLGDFTTEQKAIEKGFRNLRLFTHSLSNAEELSDCEREALSQYSLLKGVPASEAISCYLDLVQELPSYGMHFYEVKDNNDVQKWIGIGLNGITQFNFENRNTPELSFLWTDINKITSRGNKFIIEVRIQADELYLEQLQIDQNAISISPSLQQQSILSVFSWFSDAHQLIRAMDMMAVTQLNFFEQRKKFRVGIHMCSSASSTSSIGSINSLTHSSSACTQKSDSSLSSMEATQAAKVASREHYVALKNKKEELEQLIEDKETEMRRLKIEEAKLTGIIPDDLTEEEKATLPKQMATAYTLQHLVESIRQDHVDLSYTLEPTEEDKELKRLTREFEIQCSIVRAERKIYKEECSSKRIKKHRKKNYKNSEKKLKHLELELEKRREAMGISTRHSRFYSQVSNKEEFSWSVQSMSSKSMTLPSKQHAVAVANQPGKLSAVNENQISKPLTNNPRHSSAIPGRIDPSMIRNRQFKYSPTVFKKSNGSDSMSTASPLDSSSFLSLYSKDSSSHISSCSLTSDSDRCISCPATEPMPSKSPRNVANGLSHNQRVSQHLDLALPAQLEIKKDKVDNPYLDLPGQAIFRPSTRYPKVPPSHPPQLTPGEFYARSLPPENTAGSSDRRENTQSPALTQSKSQSTSDQISSQETELKPAYKPHNSLQPHNTATTHYPMPCLRVNSVPQGLYSHKSRSHEKINNIPQQAYTSTSPHTLTPPNRTNSYHEATGGRSYNYGGNAIYSNHKSTIPITRIRTTPANITALEYSKPTHYPQTKPSSPNLRGDRRSPQTGEPRTKQQQQQYVLSSTWGYQPAPQLQQSRVPTPANSRYIPPTYRLPAPGSVPQDQTAIAHGQQRFRSPYNYQSVPPSITVHNARYNHSISYPDPNLQYMAAHHLKVQHDPLTSTHSLPLSPPSPGVKSKIDYWESQSVTQRPMLLTQSMELITANNSSDLSPIIEAAQNRQSLDAPPNNYRKLINSDGYQYQMVVAKRDYPKEMLAPPDEGTPV